MINSPSHGVQSVSSDFSSRSETGEHTPFNDANDNNELNMSDGEPLYTAVLHACLVPQFCQLSECAALLGTLHHLRFLRL